MVVGANSTSYLWLSVVLVTFGYAQDVSNNAQMEGSNTSACSDGQFECQNRKCIESGLLCDGRPDCLDSSDETEFECARPELTCPLYAFRCNYGACIDRELVCDGVNDCIVDGSDEDPKNCAVGSSGGYEGSYTPPLTDRQMLCFTPIQPINGQFKLRQISFEGDFEYVDPPKSGLQIGSVLVYTCAVGYKIRGNAGVRCSESGRWTRKPICIKVRCGPLSSLSTAGNCTHANGRVKPCSDIDPVYPKTKAQVYCRLGYMKDTESSTTREETVTCSEDGKWEPEPIRCIPVCGVPNWSEESFATVGPTANIGTFPWDATLYVQKNSSSGNEKVFRCSATVIQADLLLTAAHCIYDIAGSSDGILDISARTAEVPYNFFVVTGNVHLEYDSRMHDPQFVRKHRVRNVHTDCSFRLIMSGNYFADIALLELEEPLEFTTTLLPACLDGARHDHQILEARVNGRVTGSARSRMNKSSLMLQSTTVPYVPDTQCTALHNATRSTIQISRDKFCTSYNNGPDSCANDGAGLVYEINNLWYLRGIVSRAISVNADDSVTSCDKTSHLLYTNVSQHMKWIRQVISDLERFKYPPCSRYLPPFRPKIKTQQMESVSSMTMAPITMTMAPITMTMASITMTMETVTDSTPDPALVTTENHVVVRYPFNMSSSSCIVPEQPYNGEWRLHRDFCGGEVDCHVPESDLISLTRLAQGSQLVFSCNPGYFVKGSPDVYCRANGKWSPIPVCAEIQCNPLNSESLIATCSRFGQLVDCDAPVSPDTEAKVSCRFGFQAQQSQSESLICNTSGFWEPAFFRCVPVCGATFHSRALFPGNENATNALNFPWHATLYIQRTDWRGASWKEPHCGATLIQANLVITAAHCVYNEKTRTTEDPRKLFILLNNIHRQFVSLLHDLHSVRKGTVKNVHIHCKYRGREGNYVADIAILELQERFEFFNIPLHPACLDFSGCNEEVLGPGASGTVLGFIKTTTGVPSEILQTISVPYIPQAECNNSNIASENKVFISSDKFCAGYNNGTAVCLSHGGAGLFIQINGLWHIVGIMSVDLTGDATNGGSTCNGDVHMLYTKTSDYMTWILDVMFHLERYQSYPPCSRNRVSSPSRFQV